MRVLRPITRAAGLAAFAISLGSATESLAQPTPSASPGPVLDEIIVTARYKRESLQDVPQAISAFDDTALAKIAARDLTDLAPASPNVNIQTVAQFSNSAAIHIRGLGAQGIESTEESPVGVSIDGVYITRPVATLLDTFDTSTIEVLRGPQGTSFGKNSLAGGIAVYSKDPGDRFGAEAEGVLGNYGRADIRGAVEGPLVEDRLAARFVANKATSNGWFTNRFNNTSLGGQDRTVLKGAFVFRPNDTFTINLKAFDVRDRSSAPGGDTAPDRTKLLFAVFRFEEPNDGPYTVGRDFPSQHSTDQTAVIGKVVADFGSTSLTSITGHIKTDDFNDSDFDQSEVFFFPTFRVQSHKQTSQEFRLQSDFSDRTDALNRLNLVAGFYYLDQSFAMAQAFPTLPVLLAPTLNFGSQDYVAQDNEATAVFGQAIYGVTDQVNVTLGARQSWESKDYFRDPTGTFLSPSRFTSRSVVKSLAEMERIANTNFAANRALKSDYSRNRLTLKFGVDYRIDDDTMVYAGYSEGYKGGGYGARAATLTTAGPTKDNTAELFEVGLKSEFLDQRARLNVTGFITKFKNLEFGIFFPNPNVASGQETAAQNIGAATSQGFEIEGVLQPAENLTLTANLGYLDSKYTAFCADLDGPAASATTPVSTCGGRVTRLPNGTFLVDQDNTNLKLVRAPKWQIHAGAEYAIPLGSAGQLTAGASLLHKSKYFSSVANELAGLTGDYTLIDGSLTWQDQDERFRVMLWGKNLTDKTYVAALTPTAQFFIQRFYNPPRTYGITLGVKY